MPELNNASRRVPKATYIPLQLPKPLPPIGRAIHSIAYIRNLLLQPGEVDSATKAMKAAGEAGTPTPDSSLWDTLRLFEGSPMPSELPPATAFANTQPATLLAFGRAVASLRQQGLKKLQKQSAGVSTVNAQITDGAIVLDPAASIGKALARVNTALLVNNIFEQNVAAAPIGMLNLEHLEMTPAGIERGELLATIPLAPREQTSVVQTEWSNTSKEFTSIVMDSLENVSEKGVTENTDLSQSTTSQTQHSSRFNISDTVSGGILFLTEGASMQFGSQDSNSNSAADSRKHSITTTRKASARVKEEHKVTISSKTAFGTSETSTRTFQNPSDTDPMRIDYFSLMRKWRVRLYRYGLRMTYDIAIPEPGATLREIYARIDDLQSQSALTFSFPLRRSAITTDNYQQLADQYSAKVPPAPQATDPNVPDLQPQQEVPGLGGGIHRYSLPFSVNPSYRITKIEFSADMYPRMGQGNKPVGMYFDVLGSGYPEQHSVEGDPRLFIDWTLLDGFLYHATGDQLVEFSFNDAVSAWVGLRVFTELAPDFITQWQESVWEALFDAAQAQFFTNQQSVNAQIQTLQAQLDSVDTLTLRREEHDEIMKGVLRWLLGTGFDFMPTDVVGVFDEQQQAGAADLHHGVSFTGNELGMSPTYWATMFQYGEMVKFVNQAIDWESTLYFLYSYFWDVPESWEFIRKIQHSDPVRQSFLRAGSARVVLTVRKGWEEAWARFVELGDMTGTLPIPSDHPYLTIATEIQNYDETNYPGIPPANPAGATTDQQGMVVTTSSDKKDASPNPVTIVVQSSKDFSVGAKVTIDTYDSGKQEVQPITSKNDNDNTLTVRQLKYDHGSNEAFPIVQPGESGILIGEWYEYTPTSATDIAVNTSTTTITIANPPLA